MAKEESINIKPLKIGSLKLKIKGISPFLPEPAAEDVADRYDKKKI